MFSWGDKSGKKPDGETAANEQLRTLNQLFRTKCDEVEDLQESLRVTKRSLAEKAIETEAIQSRNDSLEKQVELLTQRLEESRALLQTRTEAAEQLAARLAEAEQTLGQRHNALADEVETLRGSLKCNNEQLDAKEQRISTLRNKMLMTEQGIEIGKLHIKQLTSLLSGSPQRPSIVDR
mmetsp:Transcript_27863/g.64271  ORF Transcript_27863/g.64271 Transcript_27863/m.64271 type:complete len:179 (-) Transcript_27863:76-612(-)